MRRSPFSDRSRAVLIGVSRYNDPSLPDLTSVGANLHDLKALLSDEISGSIREADCFLVEDPEHHADVGDAVSRAAREATDVLIVYYAGHGVLSQQSRLFLALANSVKERIEWSGIDFELLRGELRRSRAKNRILILDCCYAGRAFETMGDKFNILDSLADVSGTYTMVSSGPNELSVAPEGERNTAFTGSLIRSIAEMAGSSLDEVYLGIEELLDAQGRPKPRRRQVGRTGELVLYGYRASIAEMQHAALEGDIEAMCDLAGSLWRMDRPADAEPWFIRAANGGCVDAMHDLGSLLRASRRVRDAEYWLSSAGDLGDTCAQNDVAELLEERDAIEAARSWFERAAGSGHLGATLKIARLCHDEGELENAERWYRLAVGLNSPSAMHRLGLLLRDRGDHIEAEALLRSAIERDEVSAIHGLGLLLNDTGRVEEATLALRSAASAGDVDAMLDLGVILDRCGERTESESWFRKADGAVDAPAIPASACPPRRGSNGRQDNDCQRS